MSIASENTLLSEYKKKISFPSILQYLPGAGVPLSQQNERQLSMTEIEGKTDYLANFIKELRNSAIL